MNSRVWGTPLVVCAVTLTLDGTACNKKATTENPALTTPAGHEGAPITLTGCVQKGSGLNNYVLTQVSSPAEGPVATTGNTPGSNTPSGNPPSSYAPSGGSVQSEQMRAAQHAYQLSGHHEDLRDLVGKQVRITGTIAENSDLNKIEGDQNRKLDIDTNDLAKVDVQTVEKISDACGLGR